MNKQILDVVLPRLAKPLHTQLQRYRAGELCRRVTGKPLSPRPLVAYLREKYAPLYGI